MKRLGLLVLCLFVMLTSASLARAQKIQYSPDGNSIGVTRRVKFANDSELFQFILFNEKTGSVTSEFVFENAVSDFMFHPNGKELIYSDRLTLDRLLINEKNGILEAKNLNSFDNYTLEMSLQDKVNDDYLDTVLCRDSKKVIKIYTDHFLTFTYPDLKNLPAESRSYLPNSTDSVSKQFIAISPDCSVLIESETTSDRSTLVTKKQGQKEIKTVLPAMEDNGFIVGKISRNNQTLILERALGAGFERQVSFYDLTTGKLTFEFNFDAIESHGNNIYNITLSEVSPDGKKAALRFEGFEKGEQTQILFLVDLTTRKVMAINREKSVNKQLAEAAVFSPDSTKLATLSTVVVKTAVVQKVEIWSAADGKKLKEF